MLRKLLAVLAVLGVLFVLVLCPGGGIAADPRHESSGENGIEAAFLDDKLDFLEDDKLVQVADPIAPWNRAMFTFNDRLYFWLLKPLSRGYAAVIPTPFRQGVSNFFNNLSAPVRIVNSALQGKWQGVGSELIRFLINSTAGIGGIGDPAQGTPWAKTSDEDLGQTLAVYGIGNGFYIVWPLLGPSTLRDTVGDVGDRFLNPLFYIDSTNAALAFTGLKTVNETSFRIGDYEALKESAIAPYEAFRDAYIQYRSKKAKE